MKRIFLMILATVSALLATGCGGGGSKDASDGDSPTLVKTYDFTGFSRVNAGKVRDRGDYDGGLSAEILEVTIVRDDEFGVELRVLHEEDASLFEVTQEGDEITIWIDRLWTERRTRTFTVGKTQFISSTGKVSRKEREVRAQVTVHMPQLRGVTVEGFSTVDVDGEFETEGEFGIDVAGVASFNWLNVKAGSVNVVVEGVADISNCGFVAENGIDIDFSGFVRMHRTALTARSLDVEIAGASLISGTTATFERSKMEMSGACKVRMDSAGNDSRGSEPTCGSLDLEVDGVALVDLSRLRCMVVKVEASDLCKVKVYATESLRYIAESLSRLRYYGDPAFVSGDGSNVRSR